MIARRWRIGLVVLVLLLAGCGGGSSGTTTPNTSESGIETTINDADQALADASVLSLSDFPTGWREVVDDSPDDEGAEGCFDLNLEGLVLTGEAESNDFEMGSTTNATSVAGVFDSVAGAEKMFAKVSDGTFTECVAQFLRGSSDDEVTVKNVEAARLSFPGVGDESDARQVVAELESQGISPSIYADMIAVRSGRAFSYLLFFDVFSAFDSTEEVRLVNAVAARMAAGQ